MPINRSPPLVSSLPMNFSASEAIGNTPFIRKKRRNDGELFESGDMFDKILCEIKELKSVVLSSNNNINLILKENKLLKAEVEILKNIVSKNVNVTGEVVSNFRGSSYADQVKTGGPVVLITPFDSNQKSDTTKEFVKEKINPVENQVSGIRNAAKGAVVVECKDKTASELLKTSAVKSLGDAYKVELPKRRKPKFKLCGMSDKLTDEQIIDFLIKQNECLKKANELKVLKTIEVKDRFKNARYQSIIEVDPESFKKIMNVEKVYVNWDSCKVFEHLNVVRCYKCLGFNHYSKECTRKRACKFCAEDHESSTCSSQIQKCINCSYYVQNLKMHLEVNHHAFSADCKVLQRKYSEEKRKVDLAE